MDATHANHLIRLGKRFRPPNNTTPFIEELAHYFRSELADAELPDYPISGLPAACRGARTFAHNATNRHRPPILSIPSYNPGLCRNRAQPERNGLGLTVVDGSTDMPRVRKHAALDAGLRVAVLPRNGQRRRCASRAEIAAAQGFTHVLTSWTRTANTR
jgi:hypothetical protein